ncbi:PREDICTED: vacuolar-processing enzyme delta-isozyme [Tarenaya hassleriana]|uniref:vacuolar-processing enzyme delta-isozyme n=1 Tax=Tarenaya hassleriana TaxID=28532 RepID=UPI00053C717C|nr:PREDICTED: vacuolar-processing enzyme delta-isozyme [Tarenaya hassleriana]
MCSFGYLKVHVLVYVLLIISIKSDEHIESGPTRWAILIAGSSGYDNYRHQADVCHAYQILKKGGLKDENIVVFMYDDIAYAPENPRPGVVINKPDGNDVYHGVPKDYTGDAVNTNNLFNVILGNRSGVTGGSGKVVDSSPDDNIFIYYADHGAPGLLGMPQEETLVARDLIDVLEKKHKLKGYTNMVIYVEACESGSVFEGLLKDDLNIYAVTAANAEESSWGYYCPIYYPFPPTEYDTCLGDVFSIAWLEDSDLHDMGTETLKEQYEVVKRRTGFDQIEETSHVMRYGTQSLQEDYLISYIGNNPLNQNITTNGFVSSSVSPTRSVNQRDIRLLYLRRKMHKAPKGSWQREEAKRKLLEEINQRKQIDRSITKILQTTLRETNVSNVLMSTRRTGQPLVDDWDCFKTLVNSFKKYCGASVNYGLKYAGALANVCNMRTNADRTVSAIKRVCHDETVRSSN